MHFGFCLLGMGVGLLLIGLLRLIQYAYWRDDFEGIRTAFYYRQELKSRQRYSPEEFYQAHYAKSNIPQELVQKFLTIHAGFWKEDPALLRPHDDLFQINGGLDMGLAWLRLIESELGVQIPPKECERLSNGSFDALLRLIHEKQVERTYHSKNSG